jgi:pilus assembly protein Flp/PilA
MLTGEALDRRGYPLHTPRRVAPDAGSAGIAMGVDDPITGKDGPSRTPTVATSRFPGRRATSAHASLAIGLSARIGPWPIYLPLKAADRHRVDAFELWRGFALFMRARFGHSERGASLVEYALLVALIAVVCIVAVSLLGKNASKKFSTVGSAIQ